MKVIEWLMKGDPAIRWQTCAYLGADKAQIEQERSLIESKGWGARLLRKQGRDGQWAQSLYNRKW